MKYLKKTLVSAAIGASLMAAGQVQAGAIGTAYLEISNLLFSTVGGGVLTLGSDIIPAPGSAGIVNNGDTRATLNGVTDTQTGDEVANPLGFDVSGPGFSCVGDCASYTDDSFAFLTQPADVPGGSYAVNDINLIGSAIDFGLGTTGATATALAESAVVPDAVGSAQGNVGLLAQFNFIAGSDFDLQVDFDYDAYIRAALIDVVGVSADASIGWVLTVRDLDDGGFFRIDLSNTLGGIDQLFALRSGDDREFAQTGTISASTFGISPTPFFNTGNEYLLQIVHDAQANSRAVPVPATLALFGLGLLGLGWRRGYA